MRLTSQLIPLLLFLSHQVAFGQTRPVRSDNPRRDHVDSVVDQAALAYFADGKAIGLSIGVVREGKIRSYHYGENVQGQGRLPSDDRYYNIGSIAKTFVGTLLAQAVLDHRIGLQDDIRRYLPGDYPNLQFEGHPITVVDLANHTSGLPTVMRPLRPKETDSLRQLDFPGQARFLSDYNADSLLADLHHVHPDTLPGMRYRYNTNAVMLLQLLLERVYHDSYTHLITRWLQTHLRLYQTTPWLGPEQLRHTAQGYTKAGEPQPYVNLGGYYIGPTMNATFHDLLLFLQAEIAEGDPAIRLSHQRTWGTGNFGVGLNWMIDTEGGLRYLYHDGNTKVGFNSLCTVYPSQRLGIFVIGSDVQDQAKIGRLENVVHDGIVRSAQLSP